MTEESWRSGPGAEHSPDELSSIIVARLQELSKFVSTEIDGLSGSMQQLQQENQELRDELSSSRLPVPGTKLLPSIGPYSRAYDSYKKDHRQPPDESLATIVDLDGRLGVVPDERPTDTTVDLDKTVDTLVLDPSREPMLSFDLVEEAGRRVTKESAAKPSFVMDEDSSDDPSRRLSHESEEFWAATPSSGTHASSTVERGNDLRGTRASSGFSSMQDPESIVFTSTDSETRSKAKRTMMRQAGISKRKVDFREYTCLDCWKPDSWNFRSSDSVAGLNVLEDTDEQFNALVQILEDKRSGEATTCCFNYMDPYMVSPLSRPSVAIDIVSFILIAYDCLAVPMLLLESSDATQHPIPQVMTWISRIFWTLAIPRSFFTGFMKDDGTIEVRAAMVWQEYRNSWLLLDVLIVSADWLDAGAGGVIRFARLLKAARLARMVRVPNLLVRRLNHASSERMLLWLSIVKSTMSFVLINHFLACIWFWVGTLDEEAGWVAQVGVNNSSVMNKYGYAVHWAASQFIGSTEVPPYTGLERSFGALVMILAFIWSASFISRITAAMTRLQILAGQTQRLFSSLRQFLVQSKLSKHLQMRVMSAARHNLDLKTLYQSEGEVELLRYLSEPMLIEIHYELHSGVLMQHPFFLRFNSFEPLAVQKLCHSAIEILTLGLGDVVFTQGVEPTDPRMFFPVQGTLLYLKDLDGDGKIELDEIVHVMQPMWVCEPVLWMRWMHCGNLRAAQHCTVLSLSAERFCSIIQEYRNTNYPAEYAKRIVKEVNVIGQNEDVDDLCESIDCKELVLQTFPSRIAGAFPRGGFSPVEWLPQRLSVASISSRGLSRSNGLSWPPGSSSAQSFAPTTSAADSEKTDADSEMG